jgi:restriction endonuclease S subunit
LEKDIVMCFRGAPDTFGKVGMYRKKSCEKALPNQSFVILRQKLDTGGVICGPEILMMWLRSSFAQNYLKQCSISPDVVRVKPKQIAEMEVPVGPRHLLEDIEKKVGDNISLRHYQWRISSSKKPAD